MKDANDSRVYTNVKITWMDLVSAPIPHCLESQALGWTNININIWIGPGQWDGGRQGSGLNRVRLVRSGFHNIHIFR